LEDKSTGSRGRQAIVPEVTVSAGVIAVIVIILVLVAAGAAVASTRLSRGAAERSLPGPEYDRLAKEIGPRQAKAEFAKRRQRVDGLGLSDLSDERRAAYLGQWTAAQEQFVDSPGPAVRSAGALVTAVAADRGYEVTDQGQLLTDLSVYHGRYLDGYRKALEVTGRVDKATTEAMRQALLGYRVLFLDLAGEPGDPAATAGDADARADQPKPKVPFQQPWRQVTQGRHWKTQRQEDESGVGAAQP
jgi:hypothetical protein